MKQDIGKQTWLVVGGSRNGIGTAIAAAAAAEGHQVMITGLEAEPLAMPAGDTQYHQLDICKPAEITALAAELPAPSVVVNCAAISRRDMEHERDIFSQVIHTNLIGNFDIIKAFEPALIASSGVIINIASMYSAFGSPKIPAYGASKAAIQQLTRSLAIAYAEHGVRVNAIAPGFIVTEQSARGRADPEHYQSVLKRTPFGRWGEPEDIAGVALFLASPAAGFITGQTIIVDGGYSIT